MAAAGKWYGQALIKALNKEINWSVDSIKVMLCTNQYAPDQDSHVYKSQVANEVVNGNGYTTGGKILANKTATYAADTNTITLDADDLVWLAASINARYAVIYDDTPATDGAKPLLGYIDFGKDVISTDGDFKIIWDAAGILKITAA